MTCTHKWSCKKWNNGEENKIWLQFGRNYCPYLAHTHLNCKLIKKQITLTYLEIDWDFCTYRQNFTQLASRVISLLNSFIVWWIIPLQDVKCKKVHERHTTCRVASDLAGGGDTYLWVPSPILAVGGVPTFDGVEVPTLGYPSPILTWPGRGVPTSGYPPPPSWPGQGKYPPGVDKLTNWNYYLPPSYGCGR